MRDVKSDLVATKQELKNDIQLMDSEMKSSSSTGKAAADEMCKQLRFEMEEARTSNVKAVRECKSQLEVAISPTGHFEMSLNGMATR